MRAQVLVPRAGLLPLAPRRAAARAFRAARLPVRPCRTRRGRGPV